MFGRLQLHRTPFCTFWSLKTLEHVLSCSIFIAKKAHNKVIHIVILWISLGCPSSNFFFLSWIELSTKLWKILIRLNNIFYLCFINHQCKMYNLISLAFIIIQNQNLYVAVKQVMIESRVINVLSLLTTWQRRELPYSKIFWFMILLPWRSICFFFMIILGCIMRGIILTLILFLSLLYQIPLLRTQKKKKKLSAINRFS